MSRLSIACILATLLGLAAVLTVQPDSDATKVLGPDGELGAGLDTPTGRAMAIAIIGPDRDLRSRTAQELVDLLRADPMISRVNQGPVITADLLDWVWEHRLLLAPPPPDKATPEAMAEELTRAAKALDSFAEAPFAPRYLLDPTGSFRTILDGLSTAAPDLSVHNGIFQARDDTAALIFATITEGPFDVSDQFALNTRIQKSVEATGHTTLIVGPRPISAQISTRISRRATLSASFATILLLGWLIWLTRSLTGLLRILLPVAMGAATAALLVQAMFGNVHVLALGFGGALMGLAIDYPIHLISHGGSPDNRRRAARCVLLGAITTAIAFLAISVADIPALSQIGIFVAAGLVIAAGTCLCLGPSFANSALRPARWHPPVIRLPAPLAILAGIATVATALLWIRPEGEPSSLVRIPETVKTDIARMGQMQDLPSGQWQIKVAGDTVSTVLSKQLKLKRVLEAAQSEDILNRWRMLSDFLPQDRPALPSPDQVTMNLPEAMAQAGLAESFAAQIEHAYDVAHTKAAQPNPIPRELLETTGLDTLLWSTNDMLTGTVHLWGVSDPNALATMIAGLNDPDIKFTDQKTRISNQLKTLTGTVLQNLAIGAILALVFLVFFRRDAPLLFIATAAATALTALIISLTTGPLGVFQIVALVLVTGIGIDYGLFLRNDAGERAFQVAASSVSRCAITTLIAFVTMAFSGVAVLQNIGITVSVGVVAMLAAHLLRAPESGRK